MSAQFGMWQFDDALPATEDLEKAVRSLGPLGPDGGSHFIVPPVAMFYRGFDSTGGCPGSCQPFQNASGLVITWDGRLDNRAELIRLLDAGSQYEAPDVALVARAYERLGTGCFGRLLGDWAIAIWDRNKRWVLLARDFMGCRHLHYSAGPRDVAWSTALDSLLTIHKSTHEIDREYLAGWFSLFPAAHRTPYRGIHSVPPSSFVRITPTNVTIEKYWDFDPDKQIEYGDNRAYEEHFRAALRTSVKRRLRSQAPVLAELSGGIDSSGIVCMADLLVESEMAGTSKVETISYYNDSEPNWDERPYFQLVEAQRGCRGYHIDISPQNPVAFHFDPMHFPATPSHAARRTVAGHQFADIVRSTSARVLLSGIGGDEFTGGVPTPIPELADLAATFRLGEFSTQLRAWALQQRKPWIHLLGEVARRFVPSPILQQTPAWLDSGFARRYRAALAGYYQPLRPFGSRPSLQEGLFTVEVLRRQLGCFAIPQDPTYETRYPYLDRDLMEFLLAVPRQQLIRPGRRRCLMRRALSGIVPDGILNRRRKAFVVRAAITGMQTEGTSAADKDLIIADLGIVDGQRFRSAMERAQRGEDVAIVPLARALLIETWLKSLTASQSPTIVWEHCSTPRHRRSSS
jgi:asparagine synthase (glutamine-hydrolysing)